MRVLYHPQLSMRSYKDNRWFVYKDAQSNKMRAYIEALPGDWEWRWLLPLDFRQDRDDYNALARWMGAHGVKWSHIRWADNVLEGRYHFDVTIMSDIVERWTPDVLLCEVPEHARAWRAVQRRVGVEFPIISMVEHVDFYEQTRVPEEVAYHLRQVDGALVSDRLAFPLEGMREEWLAAAEDIVALEIVDRGILPKVTVWNAIYDADGFGEEIHRAESETPEPHWPVKHGTPVINFISRLSDNQRTHYEEFFQACDMLYENGVAFEVWVANPNEAIPRDDVWKLSQAITHVGADTRGEYVWSLAQSDVVPILYPQSHIYSLGFCEAITAGNLVVTPTDPGGNQLLPGVTRMDPSNVSVEEVAAALREALVNHDTQLREAQEEWLIKDRSVQVNIGNVERTIMEVVSVTA